MATNRTRRRRHRRYSDAIECLIAGAAIEHTPENRDAVIGVLYFGDFPALPSEARRQAWEILCEWIPI